MIFGLYRADYEESRSSHSELCEGKSSGLSDSEAENRFLK